MCALSHHDHPLSLALRNVDMSKVELNERIEKTEVELAVVKLKLVEAECRVQGLEQQVSAAKAAEEAREAAAAAAATAASTGGVGKKLSQWWNKKS